MSVRPLAGRGAVWAAVALAVACANVACANTARTNTARTNTVAQGLSPVLPMTLDVASAGSPTAAGSLAMFPGAENFGQALAGADACRTVRTQR